MRTRVPQIVYLSACQSEEFERPLADLKQMAEVIECNSPKLALEYIQNTSLPPELIVIAQSRPGQFSSSQLDALVRLAPLARFIQLLGSWCEGESRTGQPWPGAKRIFWYDWPGEVARNHSQLKVGEAGSWSSPPTSLAEENWLFPASHVGIQTHSPILHEASISTREQISAPLILVCTRRSSFGEALAISCRQEGFASLWLPPHGRAEIQGVGAILWEGVQLRSHEEAELKLLTQLYPDVPILACADFPRLETQRRAISAGAKAILAKPLVIADLFWHLNRWLSRAKVDGASSDQAA